MESLVPSTLLAKFPLVGLISQIKDNDAVFRGVIHPDMGGKFSGKHFSGILIVEERILVILGIVFIGSSNLIFFKLVIMSKEIHGIGGTILFGLKLCSSSSWE